MKWKIFQRSIEIGMAALFGLMSIGSTDKNINPPMMIFVGWVFGVGVSFFITGTVTVIQDWLMRLRSRNNPLPPIGQDDRRSLGQTTGFIGRLDADGGARSSRRRLPPGGGR